MLNTNEQRQIVSTGLREYLGHKVVRANQTGPIPEFPYLGYNITTLASENNGTYGEYEDAKARKSVSQTYSYTSHSEEYEEALEIATKAREWLDFVGTEYLNENGVVIQSIGSVTDRSNLLTSGYIYSFGFDCVFTMYDEIDISKVERGEIEGAEIKGKEEY